jgi:hypothetical protein
MKRALLIKVAVAILSTTFAGNALAFNDNEVAALGGYVSMGTTTVLGDGYAELNQINLEDKSLSFAAGGGLYIDYYFNSWFALDAGMGFVGQGLRYRGYVLGEKWRTRVRLVCMEIPISLKFNIDRRFQIAIGIALWVAVSGKETTHAADADVENKWTEDRHWAPYRRANVGPKVSFAYAIPVGPIHIVPGLSWMMHLINDFDNGDIPNNGEFVMREMNIMLHVGVEWFFR